MPGLGGHFGVIERQELARLRELYVQLLEMPGALDDLFEALVFPTEGCQELGILDGLGIEKVALDRGGAQERVGEAIANAQAVAFPYF